MNYVQNIIEQFGGVRAAATALDRPPSTVQGWKVRGSIPDEQKPFVLATAVRLGVPLSKSDFWPCEQQEDTEP